MTIQQDQIIIAVVSAIVGGIISFLVSKIAGKSSLLLYKVITERVALSNEDPAFGTVQVTWQNTPVTNLFLSLVEIENASARDVANLTFKVYTNDNVRILSSRAIIVDSTYVPLLTERYAEFIRIAPGTTPTQLQLATYYHEKEYVCDVLNRGQKAQVHILSNCVSAPFQPDLFVDIQHSGVKLRRQMAQSRVYGVPVHVAIRSGLAASVILIILIALYVTPLWLAAAIAMLIGLFAQLIGAFLCRAYWKLRDLVTR
jgi:hypothetical protein